MDGIDYDPNGNIETLRRKAQSSSYIDNLSYDYTNAGAGANRLLSIADAVSATTEAWDGESASYTYDANGNMTSQSGKITSITYDERNLPTHFVLTNGSEIIANYNATGHRILKQVAAGDWEYHLRDGDRTLAIIRNDTLSGFNLYGNDMIGQLDTPNGTLSVSSGQRYFLKDHLGSVRETVNASGATQSTTDYYAFGLEMPGRSSNSANPTDNYKFTGHERDEEAGLNLDYMMARNYDPVIARFIQIDPLASEFPGWNPYHYVHNNPLNLIDPTGMAAMDTWQFNVDTQEVERIDDKGGNEVQYINYVNSEGEALKTSRVRGSEVYIGKADSRVGYIAAGVDLWAGLPEGYNDVSGYEYDAADLKMRYKILNGGSGDLKTALKSFESSGTAEPLTAQNFVNKYGQDTAMLIIAGRYIDMMGLDPGKGITTHSSSSRTLRTARTRPVTGNNTVTVSGETKTVHVGPRGGRYYINRNGNRTYLKSSNKGN